LETLKQMIVVAQQNPMMLQLFGMTPQKLINEINKVKAKEAAKEKGVDPEEEKKQRDLTLWRAWLAKYRQRLRKEGENRNHQEIAQIDKERIKEMNAHNPKYILRNYIAQKAIDEAENGNFDEVERLLTQVLYHPYAEGLADVVEKYHYDAVPPRSASELCVT